MQNADATLLIRDITDTIAESRRFQQEHCSELPITVQMIDILIQDLDAAVGRQHANAMLEGYRGLKEVLLVPKVKEHANGQCQVVKAYTQEEAQRQCPWATCVSKAGELKYQEGKWVCFESECDAEFYKGV